MNKTNDEIRLYTIPERFKEARTNIGLTQKELSSIIGVNPITISNYENHSRQISSNTAMRYAAALGVPVEVLCSNAETDISIKEDKNTNNTIQSKVKPKPEYKYKGKTTKITISSRASVNIGKNYYTFEYSEEKCFPKGDKELDIEMERELMWKEANGEVDNQIKETIDWIKSQQEGNF